MSINTKTVPLGNIASDRFQIRTIKCPDSSFATRLDLQSALYTGFQVPYLSGIRLYCSDGSPAQSLNFFATPPPSNSTRYDTVQGELVPTGISSVTATHSQTYVHGLAYGANSGIGHLQGTLWQQAAQPEFAQCQLTGIEAGFVLWFDVARLTFTCPLAPAPDNPPATTAPGSSAPPASLSALSVGIGIAIGIALACTVAGVYYVSHLRRRGVASRPPLTPDAAHMSLASAAAMPASLPHAPSVQDAGPSTPHMPPHPAPPDSSMPSDASVSPAASVGFQTRQSGNQWIPVSQSSRSEQAPRFVFRS